MRVSALTVSDLPSTIAPASIQYGLAISNFDNPENPTRFNWGFISASDNHRARPGTGYKPAQRLRTPKWRVSSRII